jgi:amino acid transporter
MRDWFVGILCAMAIFLFSYTGYREAPQVIFTENRLTNFAGILALLVALIPTLGNNARELCSTHLCPIPTSAHILKCNLNCDSEFFAAIHLASAALFFIILAYILCFKFVNIKNPQNRKREIKFYRTCGIIMFVCIAAMIINYALEKFLKHSYPLYGSAMLFWFESVALWAFGLAWLVKGKAHEDLKDFKSFLGRKTSLNKEQ